ncbi:MAG TPA: hypothetical protein RMH99_05905 [Sandaracinaceae bacterium LLY-WYZ-13_1]|nr:hypothetical protein [Sandaracinaceae bacterium LLY-WYZ-13_1]
MGTDDDDAQGSEGSPLAQTLSAPIAAGSLDTTLRAARGFHLLHPGDATAKRVVEALELLMSQVWLGGAEDDPRFGQASARLEAADLEGAVALYEAVAGETGDAQARRLVACVRVVQAAAAGAPLPPRPESSVSVAAPASEALAYDDFEDSTRVAGDGELPLGAFQYDDETVNREPVLTPEAIREDAFPDETTRQLRPGDYVLLDEDVGAPPKESTRVASPGELPLEEVRRQVDGERSDAELDLLLDEIEEPAGPAEAAEPELVLEIDNEEDDESDPTQRAEVEPNRPRRTPSRTFGRPKDAGPRRTPSRTFARPPDELPGEPSTAEGGADERAADAPARERYDSSQPPPVPAIPAANELPRVDDPVHAPLDTGEVALPSKGSWDVREPGLSQDEDRGGRPAAADQSWSGVRAFETEPATFEPGVEGMDVDSWEEPTQVGEGALEAEAEAHVAAGELGEALRIYQDLAAQSPDEQRLWDRVAEIARMLQRRSEGETDR